ncbi:putative salicylate hydroxylase [Aspergillus stella-maris]|uniref:putative salicylate hydroxylase n=1 Tax=Aspergillus stella-maris TaxID=1810926 RepID=UPI003CCD9B81
MKVIIVGAGIAGLSAGIALRRKGHDVQIFERSSLLHEIGAAINAPPNASRVLAEWGFDTKRARMVAAQHHIIASVRTLDIKSEIDFPNFSELYGGSWLLAHRVDLHVELRRVATDPAGQGKPVEIVLKAGVVDYNAEAGSIVLSDQSEHHADVVVAADGVHTSAISHVVGHPTPAHATGWAVFRWLMSTEELQSHTETSDIIASGATKVKDSLMRLLVTPETSKRVAWYPCSDNKIQNFVIVYRDDRTDDHEREDWDRSASVEKVLSKTTDFHPSFRAIIRKARDIKRWPLLYREPIPTMSKGRLVLIGDAAHPMLPHQGQGGAMAIEDAAALGEVLTDLPTDPSKAEIINRLRLFEKIRLRRVSAMQILSNAGQDQSFRIRERAQEYMPEGVAVPTNNKEFWEHNFGYDVIGDSQRQLQVYLREMNGGLPIASSL